MKSLPLILMLALLPVWGIVASPSNRSYEESVIADTVDEQAIDSIESLHDNDHDYKENFNECLDLTPNYGGVKKMKKVENTKDYNSERNEPLFHSGYIINLLRKLGYLLAIVVALVLTIVISRIIMENKWTKNGMADADNGVAVGREMSILGHDFPKEIEEQARLGNFKEAVRLIYLFVLFSLNSKKLIAWNECKTPTEYYNEMKDPRFKQAFWQVTVAFLKVRFGNVEVPGDYFSQIRKTGMTIVNSIDQQTR